MRKEGTFLSSDGVTKIHVVTWLPKGETLGVLQLCHGMVEHILRYDDFADYMTKKGFVVVGHDHLGHGQSVVSEELHGFFQEKRGNECMIRDIHRVRQTTQRKYAELPYFLLGHSMGSFLVRQYVQLHGDGLTGLIAVGTGYFSPVALKFGQILSRALAARHGWKYHSILMDGLIFGSYNKRFCPNKTQKDWICSDEAVVEKYIQDPLCNFNFTVNGYYHMIRGISFVQKMKHVKRIPKDLPIYLTSGEQDPVGDFGKGVCIVMDQYHQAGVKNVSCKLYAKGRHEILNEVNKQDVYEDIWNWVEKIMQKKVF